MKVTEQDVRHVAGLANLELSAEEHARMLHDLNHILEYIDRLNQVDTSHVAPMAQLQPAGTSQGNGLMRADEQHPCLSHEDALGNAPESDGTFFTVPKVIER